MINNQLFRFIINFLAAVAELVDAHDSNSCEGNFMRVRFPLAALKNKPYLSLFFYKYNTLKLSNWKIRLFNDATAEDSFFIIKNHALSGRNRSLFSRKLH